MKAANQRGRPKRHEEIVWFGMKLSPLQRARIKLLARRRGQSASSLLIELVEKELAADEKIVRPTATVLRRLGKEARSAYLRKAAQKALAHTEFEQVEDVVDLIEY
jgi:hypothetical protein